MSKNTFKLLATLSLLAALAGCAELPRSNSAWVPPSSKAGRRWAWPR
jgi:hypothetical protein